MNRIQHLIEPHRLFLAWQRPMAGKERRSRRIVGEIERREGGAVFRYLDQQPDYQAARQEGFQGFPAFGIDEDPVTGSAHTTLTPYWAEKLGKNTLSAIQRSERQGHLRCTLQGDRVLISGQAVLYLEGTFQL